MSFINPLAAGIASAVFLDNALTLKNSSDSTKVATFDLSGISSGTTRAIQLPDSSAELVDVSSTQTLSSKTLSSPTFNGTTSITGNVAMTGTSSNQSTFRLDNYSGSGTAPIYVGSNSIRVQRHAPFLDCFIDDAANPLIQLMSYENDNTNLMMGCYWNPTTSEYVSSTNYGNVMLSDFQGNFSLFVSNITAGTNIGAGKTSFLNPMNVSCSTGAMSLYKSLNVTGGTTTDSLNVTSSGITLPTTGGTAAPLNYYSEYTHSSKFNDSASTAFSMSFVRVGKQVTCNWPSSTGMSHNGTLSVVDKLPSVLCPTSSVISFCAVQENSTFKKMGNIQVDPDGTITFYLSTDPTNMLGSFDNTSGDTCGVWNGSLSYTVM